MNLESATFHIWGWRSDGGPLVRFGHDIRFWATAIPPRDRGKVLAMQVGERLPINFRTAAGLLTYEVSREA